MIVEYIASHQFPFAALNTDVQITIAVRLISPGTPGVTVAIDLSFEAFLDQQLQQVLDQFLSQAIHQGLDAIGQPLANQPLQIDVPTLTIKPIRAIVQDGKLVGEVLRVVEFLLSSSVATLGTTASTLGAPAMVPKRATNKRKQH